MVKVGANKGHQTFPGNIKNHLSSSKNLDVNMDKFLKLKTYIRQSYKVYTQLTKQQVLKLDN
jgi:hypothetical protein